MSRSVLTLFILFISFISVSAQDKLVIDDRTGMLSSELKASVAEKIREEGYMLTDLVDFSKRCEYYFARMQTAEEDLIISVRDCNENLLGQKNMGSRILGSPVTEQGILLSYALMDILSEPGKYLLEEKIRYAETSKDQTSANLSGEDKSLARSDSAIANEHNSRYFFAPSAYNLKKGELYYNTVYFLLHDIQYGVSDYFSFGMGTTVIGLPLYFTPKLSIPVGEKSAIAIGDMLMLGTWGSDAIGNLAYGTFTTGGSNGNITFGAGHLYINESDITGQTSSLVSNISALKRISPYIFLLTENYVMSANFNREAWFYGYDQTVEETFVQRNTFWYGILGIRIVSKNRDFISWQMGLTYIVNFPGDYPVKYNSWDTNAASGTTLIPFPTVSLAIKFGKKY